MDRWAINDDPDESTIRIVMVAFVPAPYRPDEFVELSRRVQTKTGDVWHSLGQSDFNDTGACAVDLTCADDGLPLDLRVVCHGRKANVSVSATRRRVVEENVDFDLEIKEASHDRRPISRPGAPSG